jgi:DNA invertase Pin-like site-specific DNA recombinase
MDRIHRNSKNFMGMMETLKRREKEFVSMTESLDTSTAMGRFVMDIIQRIAQLESEQIGERVYDGMHQKARTNGGPLGFNIPYGYDYIHNELVINKTEEKNVKLIFDLYLKGLSMRKIAEYLNEQNVPTKKHRSWGSQTISKILKNPLYHGVFHWENIKHPDSFPIIIDEVTFNLVQNKILNR